VSWIVSNLNRNSKVFDPLPLQMSASLQSRGRGHPMSGIVEEKGRSLTGLARRTMDRDAEEGGRLKESVKHFCFHR
jgi:hypothetical protein